VGRAATSASEVAARPLDRTRVVREDEGSDCSKRGVYCPNAIGEKSLQQTAAGGRSGGRDQVPHRNLVGRHERSTVDSANDFAGWTC